MPIKSKDIRKLSVIALILVLIMLSFLVLKPILLSIIFALILAYAFLPIYRRIYAVFRERNVSALSVCILIVLIIFIPLWFFNSFSNTARF